MTTLNTLQPSQNLDSNLKSKHNKLPLIQVFRGIAALLVVAYHLTIRSAELLQQDLLFGIFKFGYAGVDFFFVLSGFIIYYVHKQDIGKPKKFKEFISKRMVRIYPIYLLITLLILPVYLVGYGSEYKTDIWVIVKSLLLLPQDEGIYPVLNVGWTLSFEALFYVMFGAAILLKPKITSIIFGVWVLIVSGMFICELQGIELTNNILINFIFNSHNLEFIFGCIVAYLVTAKNISYGRYLMLAGGAWILVSSVNNYVYGEFYVHPVIAYGIPSTLIVLGASAYDRIKPSNPPEFLMYLGDASYSIYLTHFVIITAMLIGFLKLAILDFIGYQVAMAVIILATVAIGCLVYTYIEKPMLNYCRRKFVLKARTTT
ncbi:acyltransferase family protein [Aliterella atlantica]|uniref:acyltransferase family protein n=1 Tax=Aliterella atlantica TaxID=1827278 RepID=UPI0005D355F5|nr:acyltransferase [Aliterella atlantica]